MDFVTVFYAVAVAWFSFIFLRIATWIYEFWIYPRTFGKTTNVSLNDLAGLSHDLAEDLPGFNVVIPAFQESLVIEETLFRMAEINYPRTHFDVWVVTYEDEPVAPGEPRTFQTAHQAVSKINAKAGRELARVLSVPAGFDGRFPGNLHSADRFIGKPRGLNFAIRVIHERNERDERSLFAGTMARLGHIESIDLAVGLVASAADATEFSALADRFFDADSPGYIGACALSSQLRRLADACLRIPSPTPSALTAYIAAEAPRFFMRFEPPDPAEGGDGARVLSVMEDRRFLYDVMQEVEAEDPQALAEAAKDIEARLATERPMLWKALLRTEDGEGVFQLARKVNSRWLAAYDADADVPVDLFRHLAARILTEPETMGFQGPVSPVANYDEVHPLCKLGGLSMAFWHNTGYPQLFAKRNWAHVLAGTNWCFRMDGLRQGGRLLRDVGYDETARLFILSFDPGHLTEDLEVAVRMFNDWRVNAQWHPYSEYEQVPGTTHAMIVQRRRWTLGTLQTISYMLRSRLPFLQKLKYGLRPLDILTSGSGPVVTVLLIIFIYRGELTSHPITIVWTFILTFANLMYAVPFLQTYERYVVALRRAIGVEHLVANGPALARDVERHLQSGPLAQRETRLLHDISILMEDGLRPGGFIRKYLAGRCVDDAPSGPLTRSYLAATPAALNQTHIPDLYNAFSHLTEHAHAVKNPETAENPALHHRLAALKSALGKAGQKGSWKTRRRAERRQIWRWAFVYLFWQLIPSYQGLKDWMTGSKDRSWVKTPRTRKTGSG